MKYNFDLKQKVRELRSNGMSLGQIHERTFVPKTTIRLWIKDIILSKKQVNDLKSNTQNALQNGRIKFQYSNKQERQIKESKIFILGKKEVDMLSIQELLIAGIALYWGEGFKNIHEHRLGFCNSDPEMVKFYILWLEKCLKVGKKDLVARVTINSSYKEKAGEIEKYWSIITGIPQAQFTKPFYQHVTWKKQYKTDNYHGVLRIHVKDSLAMLWKMRGWIEGLKHAKIGSTHSAG